jgi:ParB family chromosome partitioning protein
MSWQSFVTNRLPILNLPADIKDSLAEGKIAYTKAIALAKLKDEEERINLLAEIIEHNLSLKEIKERIKQLQTKPELDSPKQRINKLVKDINKVKLWEKEPKKWRKIEGWLSRIENILDDETII